MSLFQNSCGRHGLSRRSFRAKAEGRPSITENRPFSPSSGGSGLLLCEVSEGCLRYEARAVPTVYAGFTLIEVCLAVLVVGLGLLSVFSLFPSGLRSAEDDTADTRSGLFAETVMNGLRGNAATISSWSEWDSTFFEQEVVKNVLDSGKNVVGNGSLQEVQFPAGGGPKDYWLRYKLKLYVTDPNRYGARLEVCDGRYESFDGAQAVIYTEFSFTGTQP